MRNHHKLPEETIDDSAAQQPVVGAPNDARPAEERTPAGVGEVRLVIQKLDMPIRPRGVLAE